jgi:prephenate dehydrogenase
MTVQFTVIGLGQVGTSMGLALASQASQIKRVGYDKALEVQNKAKKRGAFDETPYNLHTAVEKADVVVLCLPLDQVEETLKQIGPDLREDAVVMDTAPVKTVVAEWFKTHIPAGRHYVGLIPALNPLALGESQRGPESARADLFERGTLGIVAPAGTPEGAINLAANLASLLGAHALFLGLAEADGMLAATHLLPQLTAAALLNATVGQAGWLETRRLAGRPYALATTPVLEDGLEPLTLASLYGRENVLRMLEMAIGGLTAIHAALKNNEDTDLKFRLERATDDRQGWWNDRQKADWASDEAADASKIPGFLERMLGSGLSGKNRK